MGATGAPLLAGALAEKHGLGLTMWLAAGGSAVLFLAALLCANLRGDKTQFLADASLDFR
jgi:hypothetical protein